ncbi:MAG: hypothetical protein M3Z17_12105 [Gemmatimonadota bacterium]|nr:hypothetical protein [Gemmatimonadota bacterium]
MIRKLLLIGILCAGCIKDPPTGPSTIRGTWTLRTVDGNSLPATTSGSGANQTQMVSDSFVLLEGNGFNETVVTRTTVNGVPTDQTVVITGSYGALGTSVTLRKDSDGTTRTGLVDDSGAMTFADGGFSKVYRKL